MIVLYNHFLVIKHKKTLMMVYIPYIDNERRKCMKKGLQKFRRWKRIFEHQYLFILCCLMLILTPFSSLGSLTYAEEMESLDENEVFEGNIEEQLGEFPTVEQVDYDHVEGSEEYSENSEYSEYPNDTNVESIEDTEIESLNDGNENNEDENDGNGLIVEDEENESNNEVLQVDEVEINFELLMESSDAINIPDDNLRKAINIQLGKTNDEFETYMPTEDDMKNLLSLDALGYDINNITGLEYAVNLEYLDLGYNNITDITPLTGLTKLVTLYLDVNNLTDISPLSELINLQYLTLDENNITNLTPLSGLINLIELDLSDNNISNVEPLAPLVNLERLYLDENMIENVSAFSSLTKLIELYLSYNSIYDISPLESLKKLQYIEINGNRISDISVLGELYLMGDLYSDFEAFDQYILLNTVQLYSNSQYFELDNFLKDFEGSYVSDITVTDGLYDHDTMKITWTNLTRFNDMLTFSFNKHNFSGTVYVPIEWIFPLSTTLEVIAGQIVTIEGTSTRLKFPDDIPEGTLLTVTNVSEEDFAKNAKGLKIAGDVLRFEFEYPDGAEFEGEFILSMNYHSSETEIDIYYFDEVSEEWIAQNGTKDESSNSITIHPIHFSTYGVFALNNEEEPDDETGQIDDEVEPGTEQPDEKDLDEESEETDQGELSEETKDSSITIEDKNVVNGNLEKTLPKTATSIYNIFLIGFIFIIMGAWLFSFNRKRKLMK